MSIAEICNKMYGKTIRECSNEQVYTALLALVKKVTEDIETLNFNTAISQMMIFVNDCYRVEKINRDMLLGFVKLLSPFAPHIGEEMYQQLTGAESIAYESWPTYDESKLVKNETEVVVQVNGKLRGKFMASVDASEEQLKEKALAVENVRPFIEGKTIRKIIVIKGKVVNIVAN